jgi:hypothetical protein
MKAFVIGALLVQTLHAQVSDDFAATPDVTTDEFAATLAPLIIPGPDVLSEAELSSEAAFGTGADAIPDAAFSPTADAFDSETTPFADTDSLPIGTADVIIDQTSSEDPDASQATPVSAEFGSGATPDAGVSFNGTGWTWPQAQVNASSEDPDYLNGFAVSTQSSDLSPTQDADAVTSPFGIGFEDPYTSAPYANYTTLLVTVTTPRLLLPLRFMTNSETPLLLPPRLPLRPHSTTSSETLLCLSSVPVPVMTVDLAV